MNFESARISEMNQLNNEHQMLNNTTTPSNSLFDGHMQKYPISPMMNSSYNNARDDSFRNNVEAWRMEMERKVNRHNNAPSTMSNLTNFRSLTLKSSVMKR